MAQIKSIILGATGLVGGALTQILASDPDYSRPVTLTRKPACQDISDNYVVDFENLDAAAAYFSGDVLFSCLGTTRRRAGSLEAQRRVDVDYQLQVAQIAQAQGVKHYCLVSSSGADATSKNPYLQMKGVLEDQVKQLGFERVTVMQPSLLLGPRDHLRVGEKIGSAILPLITLIPSLRAYRPIPGATVARKMAARAKISGPAYEVFRLDEIFD
jgi:uncharacterized protein YbjT (DUF2867 family)